MGKALAAHWRYKAALSVALTLAFCVPYFLLQHVVIFPVRRLPLSLLDLSVPFSPGWVWIYQSVYIFISIVPWFASSTDDLHRYARGFLLQAYIGFAVFLLFPIAGPRPDAATGDLMFRLLLAYDSPLNSLPSLHVGLAVYTVLVAVRLSRDRLPPTARVAVVAVASLWCAAIAYSAIATRQHYAIDLPAGAVLAVLGFLWSWSHQPAGGAWLASRMAVHLDATERSAHAEAPGARVSAGGLAPWRGRGRISATTGSRGQSAGGSGSRGAARAQSDIRTGGA